MELQKALNNLILKNHETLVWIRGHSNQGGNKIADSLARKGAADFEDSKSDLYELLELKKEKKERTPRKIKVKQERQMKISVVHPPPIELDEPIQCDICSDTYRNNVAFSLHSISHSDDGKYSCHICNYRNASKYHIEMHIRAHEVLVQGLTKKSKSGRKKGLPKKDGDSSKKGKSRRKSDSPKKIIQNHPPPIQLDEPIQCDICSASYTNNVDFALHSLSHSEDGKYTCHLCNYRNGSKYHLEMHVRAHEGTTKYKCDICSKAFTISTHAAEHKNFHTGEKPFQCEICGKHFMFSWHLASHRRTSHYEILTGKPLVKFDCTQCKKHYESASGLRRHNIKNHNYNDIDLSVLCDICGKRLSSREKLKYHLRTHTGYRPHANNSKYRLEAHVRAHEGSTKYKCEMCGKAFRIGTHAIEHKYFHTGERPFQCEICGKHFMYSRRLASHRRNSHYQVLTGKPKIKYECDLCDKKFESVPGNKRKRIKKRKCIKQKKQSKKGGKVSEHAKQPRKYTRHLELEKIVFDHLELEEEIKCATCSEPFTNNLQYALHSKTHSKDEKYSCHFCEYRTTNKYLMETHIRSHEGTTKRYKCETCDKVFRKSIYALEHKYFHTGETPFQCEFCGKHFMYSETLSYHRRSSHYELLTGKPLKKFDCTICNKHYESKSGLSKHKLRNEGRFLNQRKHRKPKDNVALQPPRKPRKYKKHSDKIKKIVFDRLKLEEELICTVCCAPFTNNIDFALHSKIHSNDEKYSCHFCEYRTANKYSTEAHVRGHEGTAKIYKCDMCNKVFRKSIYAIEHKYFHTGEKPFQCEICGKHFMYSKSLINGRKKSLGKKLKICNFEIEIDEKANKLTNLLKVTDPLKCEACGKNFNDHIEFGIHSKVHAKDKSYTCHICSLKVKTKYHIQRHITRHGGYKCEVCNKIIKRGASALRHSYTHSGLKLYQCEICRKNLANPKSLHMHLYTIHHELMTGKPLVKYDCAICHKHYESETGLRRHYSSRHKEMGHDWQMQNPEAMHIQFSCSYNDMIQRVLFSNWLIVALSFLGDQVVGVKFPGLFT
ncbi:hypothetical protein NQ317_006683 [Molorchus minor]|uniref:Uncharacterized protein n=1 Tax=Molorchus minor TaxID=1323400 RepID=A0ABQ9JTZ4_9CUCU|nr:hypothetical protein NQ317_006683 [Molorchus minor]